MRCAAGEDFREANLTNAGFYSATLTGADLTAADARVHRDSTTPTSRALPLRT